MLIVLNIILNLFFLFSSAGAEPYLLEKIIVRPYKKYSPKVIYSQETLKQADFKERNYNSVADSFEYISGIDLRYRGTLGVQGDLSLRGSSYEQVAVLIDGIKVMDPQTGHHNLDLPLTRFDVGDIEVLKEGVSGLYGAGALAGSVNIITKRPSQKAFNLETLFGEHALFAEAFSLSFPQEDFSGRLSFEHKISKAARPNTDFEYKTATLYLDKYLERMNLDALLGYQKKDFGADSFYSNLFPEEEEHTETLFVRTGLDTEAGTASIDNNLFFRRHKDKFILTRNNPGSVNYHTTYVYGFNSALELPVRFSCLIFGTEVSREQIYSTNLGKHSRLHEAFSLGFIPAGPEKLAVDFRSRLDHYQGWGIENSFNLGIGYDFLSDRLRIKSSLGRAFRIPSFTELYYSDPANKGNPNLGIERSDSFKLGLECNREFVDFGLEWFYRKGRNLIDWMRISATDPWQATNLGKVDSKGIEFKSVLESDLDLWYLHFKKIVFSYTYTETDKKTNGFFSKYALDILKHQFILLMDSAFCGLNIDCQLSYNQRHYGETYFVGSLYIAKRITGRGFLLEPFVRIDNFTNTKYSEVAGVLQPARWIKSGVRFEW